MMFVRGGAVALSLVLALGPMAARAAGSDGSLRAKVLSAFKGIKSYRITVLGSVRSNGVFVAPDRYKMTTDFDGKTVKTIFIGRRYWIYSDGRWQKSDGAANSLDFDIAGLVRNARADASVPFVAQPEHLRNGKKLGSFSFAFKNGSQETCDYDLATYLVARCKADELTILYSGYNDPANSVPDPR